MTFYRQNIDIIALLTAGFLSTVIPFALLPIISRIYNPSDFGTFYMIANIATSVLVFSTLKFDVAISFAKSKRHILQLINISFIFLTIILVISLIVILIIQINAKNIFKDVSPYYAFFIPLIVTVSSLFSIQSNILIRLSKLKVLAKMRVKQNLLNSLLQIMLGITGLNAIGLLSALIISHAISIPIKITALYWPKKKILSEYKRFPIYEVPYSIVDLFLGPIVIIMLSLNYSPSDVGLYGMALKLASVPLLMIGSAVSNLLNARMVANTKDSFSYFKRYFLLLLLVGVLLYAAVSRFYFIVPYLLGDEWQNIEGIIKNLALWLSLKIISSPLSIAVIFLDKQKLFLYTNLFINTLILIIIYTSITSGDDFLSCITLLHQLQCIYFIMFIGLLFHYFLKFDKGVERSI
jgi:lipopolysaccharide exporter